MLDLPFVDNGKTVCKGHGLGLVVGDIDRSHIHAPLQLLDLDTHLHAQLCVEVRKRFVEQKHLRVAHNRPSHGDPLPLPTRQLVGLPVKERVYLKHFGRVHDPALDLVLGHFAVLQPVGHISAHRHMRIKRIVLEHHGHVSFGWGDIVYHPIPDQNFARGDALQTRHHTQQRRFSAARGTNEYNQLAIIDLHIDTKDCFGTVRVCFADFFQFNLSHYFSLSTRPFTNHFWKISTTSTGGRVARMVKAKAFWNCGSSPPSFNTW